ncbi:glycoside hydrolase family 88 protein [Paracandidimonas soli]|uniref:Unsaturated chondroitin disaccharide hydrolase n=1 Tax=Paracandidimonas soli TaxID=1917182 RepID=A0A4R3V405_9BURK|nr:glycoside hydrolase family 88 protein [Paracandidimonas soli]TCU98430.1 unsaturated chondroitin disaccharide hydrolase [Paracandidimonas soli]
MPHTPTPRSFDLDADTRALFSQTLDRTAQKVAEDEPALGVEFPHVTAPDGSWITVPASVSAGYTGDAWSHGNWLCGFWVGLLLASYLQTGDARFLTWARERMRLVAQRADDPNTHDIGFIFDSSAIPGYLVTGDAWFAGIAKQAADRLRARLVTTPAGAYIASWGPISDPRGRCSSAIDTMANLPLLYWASHYTDDASYRLAADAHAAMTARAFFRNDDSTYHAVQYDIATGERVRGYTFQGAGDETAWSRGQAWAIYGYTRSALETRNPAYLELAERSARYYLQRLGDRVIPPYDFDATGEDAKIRDTAAAAIVSSALIELGQLHPDASKAQEWHALGVDMLAGLCREGFANEDSHRGLLREGCYSRPHGEGVVSATMFGDFYFVEALCRVLHPGRFRLANAPIAF